MGVTKKSSDSLSKKSDEVVEQAEPRIHVSGEVSGEEITVPRGSRCDLS